MAGRQVRFEEGPQAAYGLVLSLSSGQGDKREVVGLLFRGGGGLYNKKGLEGFWTEQGPSAKGMALEPPPSAPSLSPFF